GRIRNTVAATFRSPSWRAKDRRYALSWARGAVALLAPFIILNSLFLIPVARAENPPATTVEAPAVQCADLETTAERIRCKNASLFREPNPTDTQGSSALVLRIGGLIRTLLSLTGIIFLMITVYSGIQWMTAGDNEEVITKTKARITRAAIGLAIIVGSWVITNFVLKIAFRGGPREAPGTFTIPGTDGNVTGSVRF
ncbi:MAG: hypothetical protein Q7S48_02130, partial [bacterium]|nr:hypothetical protein [bacterium]